ncbi:uncharacterized protein LOC136089148 [Hydra vulgaris]|uniref:Uncharacterized protein LOC136089143 n=1 Tax=Hydra vulgaris TaxID=6087 RepID=A0ABM4D9C7_HYDVU
MQFNNSFIWSDEDEENRVTILPIKYPEIWSFRKLLEALHWTAQEVALSRDKKDWLMRMNDEQRHFIKMQFAFFAIADIDVLKNLDDNFSSEITCMEARMVYAAQKDQECVHAESYSLQIEAVMMLYEGFHKRKKKKKKEKVVLRGPPHKNNIIGPPH